MTRCRSRDEPGRARHEGEKVQWRVWHSPRRLPFSQAFAPETQFAGRSRHRPIASLWRARLSITLMREIRASRRRKAADQTESYWVAPRGNSVNCVLPVCILKNVMAAMRALGHAVSLPYFDFIVAFLAVESSSFPDFFTGKNGHITLQFFSIQHEQQTNETIPGLVTADQQNHTQTL